MAINWTDAQIEAVVQQVVAGIKAEKAPARKSWDSVSYCGRPFVGVYEKMEDAIAAAENGYRAVRAMTVAEREKLITIIRDMIREEAPIMVHTDGMTLCTRQALRPIYQLKMLMLSL